ncbi:uncharacterized protein MELLADRAFT_105990 [Melampsora larici-populina 98AG31]|uniref:F-box domain-containing protein n=1 Tax=Melampsora larici-populina (strain 98AG31 / pathotype 3-4-7) TaxID=747676 RepID=F4RK02_MELLP|nr:uncharacterized protein MELLADRAFT_105990 [Melampsora larici-populina 98AG31]EGG07408.1 hypothetical protein MELLADRAFT_105990 [Melampsora larici-populina 98AG31]
MKQLSELIELIGTNLKDVKIQFADSMGASSRLIQAFTTIKDLKSLSFTREACCGLFELSFPNLRVIGDQDSGCLVEDDYTWEDISWLQVPMLENVRTIVTDIDCSEKYWRDTLNSAEGLQKGPNLKLMVFTREKRLGPPAIDPELIL